MGEIKTTLQGKPGEGENKHSAASPQSLELFSGMKEDWIDCGVWLVDKGYCYKNDVICWVKRSPPHIAQSKKRLAVVGTRGK